mmetsp:Transcript_73136/g.136704  ORF Transcript_73136/g.136704 Transcript_73136/m.136704 type:complete len:274 (-) Transcript_73136:38-859(-)
MSLWCLVLVAWWSHAAAAAAAKGSKQISQASNRLVRRGRVLHEVDAAASTRLSRDEPVATDATEEEAFNFTACIEDALANAGDTPDDVASIFCHLKRDRLANGQSEVDTGNGEVTQVGSQVVVGNPAHVPNTNCIPTGTQESDETQMLDCDVQQEENANAAAGDGDTSNADDSVQLNEAITQDIETDAGAGDPATVQDDDTLAMEAAAGQEFEEDAGAEQTSDTDADSSADLNHNINADFNADGHETQETEEANLALAMADAHKNEAAQTAAQ